MLEGKALPGAALLSDSDHAVLEYFQHMPELLSSDVRQAWQQAEVGLALFREQQNAFGQQQALYYLGLAQFNLGALEDSAGSLIQSRELARTVGAAEQERWATARLARTYIDQGHLNEAEQMVAALLEPQPSSPDLLAFLHSVRGTLKHTQGDAVAALSDFHEFVRLCRESGSTEHIAQALDMLAVAEMEVCDYARALTHLEESFQLLRSLPKRRMVREVHCLNNMAGVHHGVKDYAQALAVYREVVALSKECGYFLGEITGATNVVECLIGLERMEEAQQALGNYLQLAQEKGLAAHESHILKNLGQLASAKDDYAQAVAYFSQALQVAERLGNLEYISFALIARIEAQMTLGSADGAEQELRGLIASARAAQRKSIVVHGFKLLAEWYAQRSNYRAAYEAHQQFHALNTEIFDEESTQQVRQLTAKLALERAQHHAETYRLQHQASEQARIQAEALVQERTRDLEQAQMEVVNRLALAAEYHDDQTSIHTRRVSYYATAIALELHLPTPEIALLYQAARLHDIGKIGVPDAILLKKGTLTSEEWDKVKTHTLVGDHILSGGRSALLQMAREIAVSHHECWDGSGYPHGLSGESIPLVGRIVGVADVFDALTHRRPYKAAWPLKESIQEIERLSGSRFDPQVVRTACTVFSRLKTRASRQLLEQLGIEPFLIERGLI